MAQTLTTKQQFIRATLTTKQQFIRAAAIALLAASGTDEYGLRDYDAVWRAAERLWAAKPSGA